MAATYSILKKTLMPITNNYVIVRGQITNLKKLFLQTIKI